MKKTSARTNPKKRAQLLGRRAELWASLWLRLKGFGIIAKRHRNAAGEIDLIAIRGDLLIFAEVKARSTKDAAIDAVTDTPALVLPALLICLLANILNLLTKACVLILWLFMAGALPILAMHGANRAPNFLGRQ